MVCINKMCGNIYNHRHFVYKYVHCYRNPVSVSGDTIYREFSAILQILHASDALAGDTVPRVSRPASRSVAPIPSMAGNMGSLSR